MTNLRHLIVDLRAHAHEVPEPMRALMRRAADALDGVELLDAAPASAPVPPPACGYCNDTGRMVVGEDDRGANTVACHCQTQKELLDAQR